MTPYILFIVMFRYLLETGGKKDEASEETKEGKLDRNCNETQAPSSSSPTRTDGKMSPSLSLPPGVFISPEYQNYKESLMESLVAMSFEDEGDAESEESDSADSDMFSLRPLLSGYEVMVGDLVEGDLAHFPPLTVNDLLARVGARRVLTLDSFSFTRDITRIIIVNSAHYYGTEASRRRLRKERLAVVDKDWLLDSISAHCVRPLKYYTAGISDKELARAGYSSPLVEVDHEAEVTDMESGSGKEDAVTSAGPDALQLREEVEKWKRLKDLKFD